LPAVLLLTDAAMARHAAPGHPERPERLTAAVAGVEAGAAGAELRRPPVEAIDPADLLAIHDPAYIAALDEAAGRGGGWLDPDTYLGPDSMIAARLAAGATLQAAVAVARSEASVAFAVVRPPGHHASADRGSGFCLLNNVAIAVAGLRRAGLARRVAIVDWDVHHGDGTQAIFAADPEVCYASTHQSPLYPGSGSREERGIGAAAGTKHNVPLPPGSGDDAFIAAWTGELLPAVRDFEPDAVLVSAGYDAHLDDPLAELRVTDHGYRSVAAALGATAVALGLPGVALTLEGGYDLDALRGSIAATVGALLAAAGDGGELGEA
jgi:acetoin utilization deacetylase AcuC-like enzyme